MQSRLRSALLIGALSFAGRAWGADYYVDDVGGNDRQNGTSEQTAWQTLTPIANTAFAPGDVIHFERGGSWDAAGLGTNGLVLDSSGTEAAPITLTSYGTGELPRLTNSNGSSTWIRAGAASGTDERGCGCTVPRRTPRLAIVAALLALAGLVLRRVAAARNHCGRAPARATNRAEGVRVLGLTRRARVERAPIG